jgi:predicted acylesterase/phospholipase RssA
LETHLLVRVIVATGSTQTNLFNMTLYQPNSQKDTRTQFEQIVLLLQGGGALGSYQAGANQALAEANLQPNWVAGISIGAVNAAIIAGNPHDTVSISV